MKKKVHHKKLASGKGKEVEGPTTPSDNEGSTERPAKKPRVLRIRDFKTEDRCSVEVK